MKLLNIVALIFISAFSYAQSGEYNSTRSEMSQVTLERFNSKDKNAQAVNVSNSLNHNDTQISEESNIDLSSTPALNTQLGNPSIYPTIIKIIDLQGSMVFRKDNF